MSAHVLLNLLNKLRESDKMQGLPSILSPFRNSLSIQKYRSRNVRFHLPDDFKIIFVIMFFFWKMSKFCHKYATLWALFHTVTCTRKSVNHLCLSILMHDVISFPDATS